jgi:glycosyltransferase involved in cell wall biosynthesis
MAQSLSILAVTNIYPTRARPTLGVFVEQQIQGLKEIGLKVNVLYVNRAEQGMGEYFRMKRPLAAAVREHRPTLVHLMYGGIMADRVTSWNADIPKVVTFHGSDLLGENLSGCRRKWISRIGTFCSRRAAKRADGVVVVSARLRRVLPRGLDEAKVRVIPCGIDLQRFRPLSQSECQQRLGWEPNRFHVLFASNNGDPVKRPELARAAIAALQSRGVSAELHLMQSVSNLEVPVWMNASNVLLLTSLHEGSPTVVKEALACGLPVVSVDVGDVAERIEGIDGCYIASPEPEDLAENLSSVCRARNRIEASEQVQNLSLRSIAQRLEGFYRETLSCARRVAGRQSLSASISVPC